MKKSHLLIYLVPPLVGVVIGTVVDVTTLFYRPVLVKSLEYGIGTEYIPKIIRALDEQEEMRKLEGILIKLYNESQTKEIKYKKDISQFDTG